MSYTCPDFVDSIIAALGVTIPDEHRENPAGQADICLAEIQRLQRFEKSTRHAIAVLQDAPREDWIAAQRLFISRVRVIAGLPIVDAWPPLNARRVAAFQAVQVGRDGRESILDTFKVTKRRKADAAHKAAEKLCQSARKLKHRPAAFVREIEV